MITLTTRQLRIMKNMTAIVLFILSTISILNGAKLFLTGDLFNALYSIPKFGIGILGIFTGIMLKYCVTIRR